jgi:hypothetical protein
MVSLENFPQPVKDSLNVPRNAPFNSEIHGSILHHERIVNKEFYDEVVLPYESGVSTDADGYLVFHDLGMNAQSCSWARSWRL